MAWGNGILQEGASGPDVTQLQNFLNQHGAHLTADGDFGPLTKAAVENYQRSVGITADGVVGSITWSKITGSSSSKTSTSPSSSGSGSSANDQALVNYINQNYPGMAPLMNVPEIRNLLIEAAQQQWSDQKLQAAFYGTTYWKQHNSTQEQWVTLSPAEQQAQVDTTITKMANDIDQLFGAAAVNKIWSSLQKFETDDRHYAEDIASGKMTYEQWLLNATVSARTTPDTQAFADEQQRQENLAQQLKTPQEVAEKLFEQAHGDYIIPFTKQNAVTWANNIINGKSSYGEFDDYLRQQASQLYPFYKDSIGNGVLPKDLFAAPVNTLANELEISPEAVMADNKLWGQIMAQAQKTGTSDQPFTAADWVTYARNLPQYKQTQGAAQMVGDFSQKLLQEFGQVA